jgi:GNAT superfamily N-acetyltransferase
MIVVRPVESDEDVEAWLGVRRGVLPDESAGTVELFRERAQAHPEHLYLLAELDGELAGSGIAGLSDAAGRGFVAPRVLPDVRRRGVGRALLEPLAEHAAGLGVNRVGAHVDDDGSRTFAERFGFQELDRQVEQVARLGGIWERKEIPDGVEVTTIAARPELLEAAYPLALEGWADFATAEAVTISLEDWLRDEATLPEGSFVALADGEIVGYSGVCRHDDDGVAEDGLTVVRRDWRRRGLALALKSRELEWAAANSFREVITWTQQRNAGMRALNEALGYEYRGVSVTMVAPLPLP